MCPTSNLGPNSQENAFAVIAQELKTTACQASRREGQEWGRKEVLSTGAAAAAGALVSSLRLGGVLPANAESTLAQRKVGRRKDDTTGAMKRLLMWCLPPAVGPACCLVRGAGSVLPLRPAHQGRVCLLRRRLQEGKQQHMSLGPHRRAPLL